MNDLCWKCKEWMINKYGKIVTNDASAYFPPYQHCHHEPKEKEECWCSRHHLGDCVWGTSFGDEKIIPFYCPVCGRKLLEEK
jgi:hypothetical protein